MKYSRSRTPEFRLCYASMVFRCLRVTSSRLRKAADHEAVRIDCHKTEEGLARWLLMADDRIDLSLTQGFLAPDWHRSRQ